MKLDSISVKTNNKIAINYLLDKLNNSKFENICFSCYKFKIYTNIIIHNTGKDINLFRKNISLLLSDLVIDIFEKQIVSKIMYHDYFYFTSEENSLICNNILESFKYSINNNYEKFYLLYNSFYSYISSYHNIVLDGFITFRLKDYIKILSDTVDIYVNKFLIDREYTEFISLLKMYISSEEPKVSCIHLIYSNSNSILLDERKNIIQIDSDIFNAKYLSDISFSSNDYILNVLLSLLPEKIYVHLLDEHIDEFITTLTLIFEKKITICTDCSICKIYKHKSSNKIKK